MRRLGLILLLPQLARAEAPRTTESTALRLHVQREAGAAPCDDREQLARRVAAILGRSASAAGRNGELVITVRFAREGDALVAQVSASGPKPGVRTLRDAGPSCQGLSEAVAVAIALLSDDAQASSAPFASPPPPATAPEAARTPALADAAPPPPEAARWQPHATLSAAAGYGLGGAGTWLGVARVGARDAHWVLDLGVAASLPTRASFEGGAVQTSLWFSMARGCYLLAAGRSLEVGPCAQLGVGRLRGAGDDYGEARSANLLWTAMSLGLGAEVRLGPHASLTLEGSLWLPLERHTFSVQNRGIAWESKPIAGLLGAGLALRAF